MLSRQLRRYPVVALLSPSELDDWLDANQELAVATGETLFQARTQGTWAYLVLEGQVRILRPHGRHNERTVGMLGPGDLFGEYALVPPGKNMATCRAAGPARLLRLPLGPLEAAVAARPEVKTNLKNWLRLHATVQYLRDRCFLGFLSGPSALALVDHLEMVTLQAGRTLREVSPEPDRWYFISAGRIRLKEGASGAGRTLKAGECFGEAALLWGSQGAPVAVAETEVRCLSLSRQAFVRSPENGELLSWQSLSMASAALAANKYPWIAQRESTDCGVAALAMVAQFWGLKVSVEQLRLQAQVIDLGMSLSELQRVGSLVPLACRAVGVDAGRFSELSLPVVAHLVDGHYVVVYEWGPTGVVIGDPSSGILTLSPGLFAKLYSGHLLVFDAARPAADDALPHT